MVKKVENFLKNHYSDFNDKNSEEIAKVFLNPSRSIDKLLDAAQKAKPGVKQAIKDLLPAAMAAKIGGVYTQNNQINSQQQ